MKQDIGFIFLHGAGLGAWVWADVTAQLSFPCLCVDLPGRGTHANLTVDFLSLDAHVASVLADVDGFAPRHWVVVAHSIAGIIGLELCRLRPDRVVGLVAISAIIPLDQGSFVSSLPLVNRLLMRFALATMGTRPPTFVIRDGLCNDLSEESTERVIARYVPESALLCTDSISTRILPANSLYVLLTKDKAVAVPRQKQMIANLQAQQVVELDTGHLPMLGKPKELVSLLERFGEHTLWTLAKQKT